MNAGGTTPGPEQLAAYADGELRGPEHAAVEAWLEVCPQAHAEVDALRRLACQCRRTIAPEPSPDSWDAALNRIHAGVTPGPARRPLRPADRRPVVPAFAAAAALFVAVLAGRSLWPVPSAPRPAAALNGPLDLVDSRDVDIISMDGDDAGILLVGLPPVHEELLLAGPGDVTVVGIESVDGPAPGWRRDDAASMIVPPNAP